MFNDSEILTYIINSMYQSRINSTYINTPTIQVKFAITNGNWKNRHCT